MKTAKYDDNVIVESCAAFIYNRASKRKMLAKDMKGKYAWQVLISICEDEDSLFEDTYERKERLHFEIQEMVIKLLKADEKDKDTSRVCTHFADPKRDRKNKK